MWKQIIGTAMGGHSAPSYANMYIAKKIDEQVEILANIMRNTNRGNLLFFKRFLDDILKVFQGTTKQLHELLNKMNEIHPTLKFTMTHTSVVGEALEDKCDCDLRSFIPYLDTSLSIENGRIEVDLLKKATDRNQYLLPTSCHPKSTTKNLPYSCALRIVRICTKNENRDKRLIELKEMLMKRNYNEGILDRAIEKARKTPRKYALRQIKQEQIKKGLFLLPNMIQECLQFKISKINTGDQW